MSDEITATVETPGAEEVAQVTETANEPTEIQQEAPKGDPKIDDPWPKSARNALSRRDKQIGSLRAREAELTRRLEALEAAQTKPKNEEPQEDAFDNYGDYLKAVARFKPQDNQMVDPKEIQKQALQQAKEAVHYEQRLDAVAQQAQKAMQEVPGLEQMLDEYGDVLDSYPPQIERAFLDADNAPMAFLALAKEGKLESLAYMTPTQAAYTIAQAQIRGEQMVRASKVSKAPAPIQGARGTAPSGKPLADQSWNELKKNLNLR